MLKVEYDEARGFVRLSDKGFYSLEDEEKAAVTVRPALATCRAQTGRLRLLVICDAQVQRPEVMEAAAKRSTHMNGANDRAAYVFGTSLAKIQGSRFLESANQKCFISESAAMAWLLMDGEVRSPDPGLAA